MIIQENKDKSVYAMGLACFGLGISQIWKMPHLTQLVCLPSHHTKKGKTILYHPFPI